MLTVPIDILSRRNGLIFQSLRDATPPNYMRPFYTTKVPWQILMQRIYSEEICLKSIEIAALHNVYFSQFPPIYKLMTENNKTGVELISLVVKYMRRQQPFTRKHATYLHRFADEFLFDWMLLPTYLWKSICEPNDYKNVELLFRSSPHIQSQSERAYLDAIVNLYWRLPTSYLWKFNKSSHPSNIALRLMQSGDNEYFFFTRKKKKNEYEMLEAEKLIKMLESFRNTDTFYQHLYWLIQDKIIKS